MIQLTNKNILVVEDDEMSARYLVELLGDAGAIVTHVDSATDAIFAANSNKAIDLILMDIQLPDMNGWQLTRILKKVNKNIPIIVQSAFSLESHIKKSYEAGCDFFISKPIDSDLLFDLIAKAMSQQEKN
jgi:two-component system cell cycle response regulator DivK